MNMKLSVQVNNNSHIQIVQPEFATWKYKAKLVAEADSGDVYKKAVRKNFKIFTWKHLRWSCEILRTSILKTSANGQEQSSRDVL